MVYLFTTSVYSESSYGDLKRLNKSIINNIIDSGVAITHIILLQGYNDIEKGLSSKHNYSIKLLEIENVISLSKARNLMLDHVMENFEILEQDIIGFPDDDCWYTDGFLGSLQRLFNKIKPEMYCCLYGEKPYRVEGNINSGVATLSNIVRNSSSNTMFFSGVRYNNNGYFDERLGVGALYNGGEDLDYSLRAYVNSKLTVFSNETYIGHRNKNSSLRSKYYIGSLIAISKYKNSSKEMLVIFYRKIVSGIYLVIVGELNCKVFIDYLRANNVDKFE